MARGQECRGEVLHFCAREDYPLLFFFLIRTNRTQFAECFGAPSAILQVSYTGVCDLLQSVLNLYCIITVKKHILTC